MTNTQDQYEAYKQGWLAAARWANRDDLVADIGSMAYNADMYAALQPAAAQPQDMREAFEAWASDDFYGGLTSISENWSHEKGTYADYAHHMAWHAWQAARAQAVEPLTPREIELIDGMIEVQLHHAAQCAAWGNHKMAERQKGWDMERVELLQKLRAHGIGIPATQAAKEKA